VLLSIFVEDIMNTSLSPLAHVLNNAFSGHANPFPMTLEHLKTIAGVGADVGDGEWVSSVEGACREVVEGGFAKSMRVEGDLVYVTH
jgi:hypothetical protein